jgi:hypothetical protein
MSNVQKLLHFARSAFTCCVRISEQTATICVYSALRTGSSNMTAFNFRFQRVCHPAVNAADENLFLVSGRKTLLLRTQKIKKAQNTTVGINEISRRVFSFKCSCRRKLVCSPNSSLASSHVSLSQCQSQNLIRIDLRIKLDAPIS